jgi:hypothetical protein
MDIKELILQGIKAAQAGENIKARDFFMQAIRLDDRNETAWLWLSSVVESEKHRQTCLEKVLKLNPNNEDARRGLEHLKTAQAATQAIQPQPSSPEPPQTPSQTETPEQAALQSDPTQTIQTEAPETIQSEASLPYTFDSEPYFQFEPTEAVPPEQAPKSQMIPTQPPPPATQPPPQATTQGRPSQFKAEEEATSTGVSKAGYWVIGIGVLLLLCLFGLFIFTNLDNLGTSDQNNTPEAVTAVVYANINAHNNEDVDGYIATIHEDAPNRNSYRATLNDMYRNFDLWHTISDVEVVKITNREAQVSFVLTTEKIRGPDFRDNVVTGVFILRKEDGEWKLYDREIEDVKYLI